MDPGASEQPGRYKELTVTKDTSLQNRPTTQQLEAELQRVKYQRRYGSVLRSTLYTLITVAAIAVLVASLWMSLI